MSAMKYLILSSVAGLCALSTAYANLPSEKSADFAYLNIYTDCLRVQPAPKDIQSLEYLPAVGMASARLPNGGSGVTFSVEQDNALIASDRSGRKIIVGSVSANLPPCFAGNERLVVKFAPDFEWSLKDKQWDKMCIPHSRWPNGPGWSWSKNLRYIATMRSRDVQFDNVVSEKHTRIFLSLDDCMSNRISENY